MATFCDAADEVLQHIVDYLKSVGINYRHDNRDGRINSSLNEEQIINTLFPFFESDKYMVDGGFKINRPDIRDWYDFAVIKENDADFFVPINIKVTELSTDNLNCKMGIYFALTGILPTKISNGWDSFFHKLSQDINTYEDKDYYFLVANKNDNSDYFWNSLKRLQCLTSNGSNLPFQANWSINRTPRARSHKEAGAFILGALKDSVYKRASIKDSFDKYVKPCLEKYEN